VWVSCRIQIQTTPHLHHQGNKNRRDRTTLATTWFGCELLLTSLIYIPEDGMLPYHATLPNSRSQISVAVNCMKRNRRVHLFRRRVTGIFSVKRPVSFSFVLWVISLKNFLGILTFHYWHALRSSLRRYASGWKVASSIPWDYLILFSLLNSSSHNMSLDLTGLLTEISTKNLLGVKRGRCVRLTISSPSVNRCWENLVPRCLNPLGLQGPIHGQP
jgi:hypothetical protein